MIAVNKRIGLTLAIQVGIPELMLHADAGCCGRARRFESQLACVSDYLRGAAEGGEVRFRISSE